jgi:hypothetical protein
VNLSEYSMRDWQIVVIAYGVSNGFVSIDGSRERKVVIKTKERRNERRQPQLRNPLQRKPRRSPRNPKTKKRDWILQATKNSRRNLKSNGNLVEIAIQLVKLHSERRRWLIYARFVN